MGKNNGRRRRTVEKLVYLAPERRPKMERRPRGEMAERKTERREMETA